jgi:beta-glucosidase/6-phospho-beta-glucosidase/beta-galactosidase
MEDQMENRLKSFILGGFECSTHRRFDGRRLDMIDATGHDKFAEQDYQRLAKLGIGAARDGLRWHLIETSPGQYDFSSATSQLLAAERAGILVIWDLFHYGYPDDLDIFSPEFVERFTDYASAFARFHLKTLGRAPIVVPINEISFFAWIAGDAGEFYPFEKDRDDELKLQLVRSAIAGVKAMRDIVPGTFVISSEPAVNVIARPEEPWFSEEAEAYRRSQFQALDMLTGRLHPELGGEPTMLDMVGINYYPHNQWFYPDREMISISDPLYRPLNEIIAEVYERFDLPILITETGTEDDRRVDWLSYVVRESRAAIAAGVDLQGICLYPILNHPGWVDERHCYNGLWDYADDEGGRDIYEDLAVVVRNSLGNTKARAAR